MPEATNESGSPVARTLFGCLGLLLLPAALLAGTLYAGWTWWRLSENGPGEQPAAVTQDSQPIDLRGTRHLPPAEKRDVERLFHLAGSADPAVRDDAARRLGVFYRKNAFAMLMVLDEQLGKTSNRHVVRLAARDLVARFGFQGQGILAKHCVEHGRDPAFLSAAAEGIREVPDAALVQETLELVRAKLEQTGGSFTEYFKP